MELHKTRKKSIRLIRVVSLIVLSLVMVLYWVHLELDLGALIRPLPTDEKMIANFREHRDDFEKLVRIFRYDFSVPFASSCLVPTSEVESIMKRVHVDLLCGDAYLWIPPDPYAKDVQSQKRLLPKNAYREFRSIEFFYAHGYVRRLDAYFTPVRKYYYYTPVAPRIKKGPFSHIVNGRRYSVGESEEFLQTPIHSFSLYKSLSNYPPNFLPSECVYRQIEPQWFIGMCHLGRN